MSHPRGNAAKLGDFTTSPRVIAISLLAVGIGFISTFVAWALLRLIAFFTNVFYYGRASTVLVSPADNHLGWWAVLVPVAGGLVIGLMARYGSDRIRGHGIPEALESILIHGSKVQPRLAVLKPVSSAISIGSGGPFGAEGPIIMTGGAIGSIVAQLFHLTAAERKTLLVAGAAAGMAATFATPVTAVLLAVELLLFEWKPRSAIPVALASATAGTARRYILGLGPLFPVPQHSVFIGPEGIAGCIIAGLLAGCLSCVLTLGIYAAEDAFRKLPIHWMWWPAIGGLAIGLGGLIYPPALGVGYAVIQSMLSGAMGWKLVLGVLVVKSLIWTCSLGSGTSGGILAPQLMIGGGLGVAMAHFLPAIAPGAWPLVCMAAVLAGSIGVPLTATMLAVELTHNSGMLLPLLLACVASHGMSVLVQKRSILTERLSRRGYHLSREYGVDPLETVRVAQAMHTSVFALPETATRQDAAEWFRAMEERGVGAEAHWQRLFPVLAEDGRLVSVLTRSQMVAAAKQKDLGVALVTDGNATPVCVSPMDTLRRVANAMAESKLTRYPVVNGAGKFVGIVTIEDLLMARTKETLREEERSRTLRPRWPFSKSGSRVEEIAESVVALDGEGRPSEIVE